jgi:hypothetical protein
MKIISHRGNINGLVPEKENRPSYIDSAIQLGYDVEVDLRIIDNEFWLGHDEAQYKIELSWMSLRKDKIWFHCKDINSALVLAKLDKGFQYFCHSQEPYVCTSNGYIWVHDLTGKINDKCIIPLLSKEDIENYNNSNPYAICTDYVTLVKR